MGQPDLGCLWSWGRSCGGYAYLHGCVPGGDLRELGEFVTCGGEADFQAVDLAEPALMFGFLDSGDEVVTDVDKPVALGRVRSQ